MSQVIQALIFDLGNVLVPFDFKRGYAALEPFCSCPAGEIPSRIRSTGLVPQYETGRVNSRDFVQQLVEALQLRTSYDEFCSVWTSIFMEHTLVPEQMIAALRPRYRLVLLSNTNEIHFRMVRERYPVVRNFDAYVLSYEVGAAKPSPEIYEAAIAAAGCRADECFFTDDIQLFVEAARNVGIDAVQFQSVEQLGGELKKRGVEWE